MGIKQESTTIKSLQHLAINTIHTHVRCKNQEGEGVQATSLGTSSNLIEITDTKVRLQGDPSP